MTKQDKRGKQLANGIIGLRNTILVTLPSCSLPDEALNFSLGPSMRLIKLTTKRKSKIIQSSRKTLTDNRRNFVSDFESSDWLIELTYKQGFSFIEYMDFRREKISNLLHTLLTLVTINWEQVWIIFTYKSPRSEELVMAYPLSSVWVLDDEHIIFRNEEEEVSLKQFQLYPLYRRRLGSIQNKKENNPLWIALQFYWHHLTLKSEYMRIMALCISLESLFNTGPNEIRKTIGLCVATLLGTSLEDKEKIYGEITKLYDYRSKIAHGAPMKIRKNVDPNEERKFEDLLLLHKYTRRCLRKIIEKQRLSASFMDNKKRINLINVALLKGSFL